MQGSGGAPIIITEQRASLSGELYVTYGIQKSLIEKRYGNTSGEQFIPICAGSKRITLNPSSGKTEAVSCNAPYPLQSGSISQAGTGWTGKALNSEGKFDGQVAQAACDTSSGYFVGILGSFQDYTNSNKNLRIDPSTNPTVVGWSGNKHLPLLHDEIPVRVGRRILRQRPLEQLEVRVAASSGAPRGSGALPYASLLSNTGSGGSGREMTRVARGSRRVLARSGRRPLQ